MLKTKKEVQEKLLNLYECRHKWRNSIRFIGIIEHTNIEVGFLQETDKSNAGGEDDRPGEL